VIAVAQYVDGLGGDVLVGQIPLHATTVAGMGLVGLVFLRSRLRYGGLVLIAVGALLASPPLASGGADVLISETGGLVGLAGNGRLASNAVRPSAFVFRQWQTALRGADHAPPVMHKPLAGGTQEPALILDPLVEAARKQPSRFHCAARGICAALHNQAAVIAINKADLIGPACDRADLVIVAIPVYMKTCRSGAVLVTTRSLRRTGSLGLRISVAQIANANAGSDAAAKSMLPEKNTA
jgi:competence protein ComEC